MEKLKIAFLFVLLTVSGALYAVNGTLPGDGTSQSPYLIEDVQDFLTFLSEDMYNMENVYLSLTTDLDLSMLQNNECTLTSEFEYNSYPHCFRGRFNGNNHTLDGLTLVVGSGGGTGLFPIITDTGAVKNLKITNAYVYSNTFDSGVLCGRNWGVIDNCHVSGRIVGEVSFAPSMGLLVGNNAYDTGEIYHSSATGSVAHNGSYTGGFTGFNEGIISNCYADCDVVGRNYVGTFTGMNTTFYGTTPGLIINCYATGSCSGAGYVGGFVGQNEWPIINCYTTATVTSTDLIDGGFVGGGYSNCYLANCFWNSDIADTGPLVLTPLAIRYDFEEMAGDVANSSGAWARNATIYNGANWSSEGKVGSCLYFSGNNYLTNSFSGFIGNFPRTVSVWVKTVASSTQTVAAWGIRENGKYWSILIDPDGKYRVGIWGGTKKTSIPINDNQWHLITVTLPYYQTPKIGDVKLYIDGVLDTNCTVSSEQEIITAWGTGTTIGVMKSNDYVSNLFKGYMDEFRIYSAALSDAQVAQLAALEEPEIVAEVYGLPTAQMQDISTFLDAGWDIEPAATASGDSPWVISENSYPVFPWSSPRQELLQVMTDDLVGIDEDTAVSKLESVGATFDVKYDCSMTVPEGNVILVDTDLSVIRPSTELTVLVSSGPYDWSTNPGDGTENSPYQISTPGMLFSLPNDQFYYFELMNDLDLERYSFKDGCVVRSECAEKTFKGFFDGKDHVVRNVDITGYSTASFSLDFDNKLYYQQLRGYEMSGFFAAVYGADTEVKNLGVENISIYSFYNIGGMIGICDSPRLISNCYVTGMIDSHKYSSSGFVGGFAAYGCNIDRCYADVDLVLSDQYSGGFVWAGKNISNCNCSGSIITGSSYTFKPGGFIGLVVDDNTIFNCYTVSAIQADYLSENGFFGYKGTTIFGEVSNCFWDCQVSGIGTEGLVANGATAVNTETMKALGTFTAAGWDFVGETTNGTEDIWRMSAQTGYPVLSWQKDIPFDVAGGYGVDLLDFQILAENWLNDYSALDYDSSGIIDMVELESFAENWLK